MEIEPTVPSDTSRTCTAISIRSHSPCDQPATFPHNSPNFCSVHYKLCKRLYQEYKRRHERYEELWLRDSRPSCFPKDGYETNDWSGITDLEGLAEIRNYLRELHRLLDRCILGRQVHHEHFFKDTSDYGHEAFLVGLKEHRTIIEKALSRLESRTLELKHRQERWYQWAKTLEEQEDQRKQARKKRIAEERKLAKQHHDAVEQMMAKKRAAQAEIEEQLSVWDPVEALIREQRQGYVTLIKILLQRDPEQVAQLESGIERAEELAQSNDGKMANITKKVDNYRAREAIISKRHSHLESGKRELAFIGSLTMVGSVEEGTAAWNLQETDKRLTRIYKELNSIFHQDRGGFSYNPEDAEQGPAKMRRDFAAVQEHIFLRLVAKNPTLLNAALDKSSIEEFLDDVDNVKNMDLRNLVLRLASPDFMSVRNACADYTSGPAGVERAKEGQARPNDEVEGSYIAKVKLCGKWIYQQSATAELTRLGWFHLVLATGLPLRSAYELYTSWHELRRLDFLVLQNYFAGVPNHTWSVRQESLGAQNLRRLGCLVLWPFKPTSFYSRSIQKFSNSVHRHVLHAIMGREDKATRRFIYMLRSFPASFCVWVRDAQTGKVLYSSTEDDEVTDAKWLIRPIAGGNLNPKLHKNRNADHLVFDDEFVARLREDRDWTPNKLLKDYVELIIWDRNTSVERTWDRFLFSLVELLNKANRFHDPLVVFEQDLEEHKKFIEEEEMHIDPLAEEKLAKIDEVKQAISTYRQEVGPWGLTPDHKYYTETDSIIDDQLHPFDDDPIWGSTEDFSITVEKDTMDRVRAKLGPKATIFDVAEFLSHQKSASHIIPGHIRESKLVRVLTQNQRLWKMIEQQTQVLIAWAQGVGQFSVPRLAPANGWAISKKKVWNAYAREALVRVMSGQEDHNILTTEGSGLKLSDISLLRNNDLRAKLYPERRRSLISDELYEQWDSFHAKHGLDGAHLYNTERGNEVSELPTLSEPWVRSTLTTILTLWKSGALSPTSILHPSFPAFATTDPSSYSDLRTFFDYRSLTNVMSLPLNTIPPDPLYLKHELLSFMTRMPPTARFSLLKLQSSEHTYPLPIDSRSRNLTTIVDLLDRRWRWNFLPKDLPGVERTVHQKLQRVLEIVTPDGKRYDDVARVRIDTVLVAAEDERMVIKVTAGVAERMEVLGGVDWGRSFVGVEGGWLGGLEGRWWFD